MSEVAGKTVGDGRYCKEIKNKLLPHMNKEPQDRAVAPEISGIGTVQKWELLLLFCAETREGEWMVKEENYTFQMLVQVHIEKKNPKLIQISSYDKSLFNQS